MISNNIIVNAPYEQVYQNYLNPQSWVSAVSDVVSVEELYNDGHYQEFLMNVEKNLNSEQVRTIRFCGDGKIDIFQPEPPPHFQMMNGSWIFKKLDEERTEIFAYRNFLIKEKYEADREIIEKNLKNSLSENLNNFKNFSENTGDISVSIFINYDYKELFSTFWDIKKWHNIWNPIDEVLINYDDNLKQDFSMYVWRDGVKEEVRTVRENINNEVIDFYSIQSPPKLDWHIGRWIIKQHKSGTIITAQRNFKMDADNNSRESFDLYQLNLKNRLKDILLAFKNHFE